MTMIPFRSPRLLRAAVLALPLLAGACSETPPLRLDAVSFKVSPTANDTAPVAVDVVTVRDKKLVETLGTMNAIDWFAHREQIQRDNPTTVQVFSWELVPGQVLSQKLPKMERAWAVLVFADYASPGAHRLRATEADVLTLLVGDKDVEQVPEKN